VTAQHPDHRRWRLDGERTSQCGTQPPPAAAELRKLLCPPGHEHTACSPNLLEAIEPPLRARLDQAPVASASSWRMFDPRRDAVWPLILSQPQTAPRSGVDVQPGPLAAQPGISMEAGGAAPERSLCRALAARGLPGHRLRDKQESSLAVKGKSVVSSSSDDQTERGQGQKECGTGADRRSGPACALFLAAPQTLIPLSIADRPLVIARTRSRSGPAARSSSGASGDLPRASQQGAAGPSSSKRRSLEIPRVLPETVNPEQQFGHPSG